MTSEGEGQQTIIGNEIRLKYANKVTPEAFDFFEKVLAEEVKTKQLF